MSGHVCMSHGVGSTLGHSPDLCDVMTAFLTLHPEERGAVAHTTLLMCPVEWYGGCSSGQGDL
jgi:hypothetical protein